MAVLGFAVTLGLGVPAADVIREPEQHIHHFAYTKQGVKIRGGSNWAWSPFWPRFARRLIGMPWKNQPLCKTGGPDLIEVCEHSDSNCVESMGDGTFVVYADPASKEYSIRSRSKPNGR